MCGISAYFARESVPSHEVLRTLLEFGALRGSDAFGYVHAELNKNGTYEIVDSDKTDELPDLDQVARYVADGMQLRDVFMALHRASPETESDSIDGESIQPIIDDENGIALIHNGAVSNSIHESLKDHFDSKSNLDSEAIIWAYLHHGRNMKRTMEYLSGGFAFLMLDINKEKLYAVATHLPLWCGYVTGHGLFFSSFKEAIYGTISKIKGQKIDKMNISMWEDYYCREIPPNTISEFDLNSGQINEHKFVPRYLHPNWDPLTQRSQKQKVLVALSGGLDSATTAAVLKAAGYDVTAIHFQYGHRGEDSELLACNNICTDLEIPNHIFSIGSIIRDIDNGMLTNSDSEIVSGTREGLKQTIAWTVCRNSLFLQLMAALAESLIVNDGYGEVFLTGGYAQLTESGVYPDNSERFITSFHKFIEFGSIAGTKIKPMYVCSNLLKAEQYILLDKLDYLDSIGPNLISCDRPKVIDGIAHNCSKNGMPACGSGLLSYWAAKKAGVEDTRRYYEIDSEYEAFVPNSNLTPKKMNMQDILKKLNIHPLNLRILQRKLL